MGLGLYQGNCLGLICMEYAIQNSNVLAGLGGATPDKLPYQDCSLRLTALLKASRTKVSRLCHLGLDMKLISHISASPPVRPLCGSESINDLSHCWRFIIASMIVRRSICGNCGLDKSRYSNGDSYVALLLCTAWLLRAFAKVGQFCVSHLSRARRCSYVHTTEVVT